MSEEQMSEEQMSEHNTIPQTNKSKPKSSNTPYKIRICICFINPTIIQLSMIYAPPKVDETQRETIIINNITITKPTKGFLPSFLSNKNKDKIFNNFKTLYYYLSTICDTYGGKLEFNDSNNITNIKDVNIEELFKKIPSLKTTNGNDIDTTNINNLIKGLKTAATAAAPGAVVAPDQNEEKEGGGEGEGEAPVANGGAPPNNNFVPTNKNNSKTQKRRHRKSRAITVTNKHSESTQFAPHPHPHPHPLGAFLHQN